MKATSPSSLVLLVSCCVSLLSVCLCSGAEPPKDFLNNNFGLVLDEVADTQIPFLQILNTFTNVESKAWLKSSDDEWILKLRKRDLATDSNDEMAWVFQRKKADSKPLIVLARVVANKKEMPSVVVAEMANRLMVSVASSAHESSAPQVALKPIEPFGGLKWDDGIDQTIKAINEMEGIEKFGFDFE